MPRLLFALVYLACAAGGAWVFAAAVPGADIRYLGARVDQGLPVEKAVLARLAADPAALTESCDGETLRALRSLVLLHLDQQDPVADYDGWSTAFATARTAFRHSLGCAPADGITWAAYAMVEATIAADPALLNRLLEISLWTAPADRSALYARFKARRIAGEALAPTLTAGLEEDSRTVVLSLPPPEVVALAATLPDGVRAALIEAAAVAGPDRRRALRQAGLAIPADPIPIGR